MPKVMQPFCLLCSFWKCKYLQSWRPFTGKIGEGEIFGERGPSLDESRSVTAEADSNCILYPIDEKNLKQKLRKQTLLFEQL